ncbi:MAG: lysophospholipase [Treponema sp.]|nr:lysophospholipase [Treponema sp.]
MVETSAWIECDDGAKLFVRHWSPNFGAGIEKPAALILLVHGMAEHSLRYRRLAETLCSHNFEVWAADLRGHGKTADLSVNDPGKGGLLGHTADKNGFFRVVLDLGIIAGYIAGETKKYGERPFLIMGHSWGSFLVQAYIENPVAVLPLRGCMLSGTRGPGGAKISLGAPFLALLALLRGKRKVSKIAIAISKGHNNKPFRPNRTPSDWLSRDEKEVDAYGSDPLSGYDCSSGFYRDMIRGLAAIHQKAALARIDRNLPVYIFCGSADPVGDMGASPTVLVNTYRELGIEDLEFVIYPEARHETLNETNRGEVTEDILNWLLRHTN